MRRRTLAVLLCALAIALPCSAQRQSVQYDTGVMPYQSYHGGDFDLVSIANGNLFIDIPLFGYPQRGSKLKLSFSARFNAKYLTLEAVCNDPSDPTDCYNILAHTNTSQNRSTSGWGIIDDQQLLPIPLHYNATRPGSSTQKATFTPMEIMTPDGALHYGGELSGTNVQIALDGSGILSQAALTNFTTGAGTGVIDKEGILYDGPNGTREDPDGNYISGESFNQSSTSLFVGVTDTVGRYIPPTSSTTDTTGCTGSGSVSSVTSWTVPTYNGGVATYKFCYTSVTLYVPAALCNLASDYNGSLAALQSIVLPNSTAWTFEYQARAPSDAPNVNYGELSKVTTPLGGSISYQYEMSSAPGSSQCSAWVTSRTLDANDGTGPHTWNYKWSQDTIPADQAVQNSVVAPDQTYVTHYMLGSQETSAQYFDAAGHLMKKVDTQYIPSVQALNAWEWDGDNSLSTINKFPLSETTTLDNGLVSQKTFAYCCSYNFFDYYANGTGGTALEQTSASYGLPSDVKEYAYGQGSPGSLMRETSTQYLWSSNSASAYQNANLLDTISSTSTLDGSGNTVASKTFTYDEPTYLTASNITTQHGSALQAVRGHITTETDWLSGGSSPQSHTNWYDTGVPYQTIDPKNNATTYTYSDTYAGSLPTTVSNALGQSTTAVYDLNLGLKTSATDPNNQTTSWSYDTLGRILSVTRPDTAPGTSTHGQTSYCYTDTGGSICSQAGPPFSVYAATLATPSPTSTNVDTFDGMGRRTRSTLQSDPSGPVIVDTAYDSLGRVASVSNPYRSPAAAGDPPKGTTSYAYDALNRKVLQCQPDNAVSGCDPTQPNTSYLKWVYNGNLTTFSDEVRNPWGRTYDALGRLINVVEPTGAQTGYTYDALSNLWSVAQNGVSGETARNRSFTYDSLSRLICASNPETTNAQNQQNPCPSSATATMPSGVVTYSYDPNGNLSSKTDVGNRTITYGYDALNRMTLEQGPDIDHVYGYDTLNVPVQNGIGRLVWATNMSDADEVFSYDAMGRLIWQSSWTPSSPNHTGIITTAKYDLAGNMTDLFYPDGRHLNQVWDPAGHLSSVTYADVNGQNVGYPYLSSATYLPNGSPYTLTFGNGVLETDSQNNRLQPTEISLKASANGITQPIFDKQYCYGPSSSVCSSYGVANNGNIWGINDGLSAARYQGFTYDSLNRLAGFSTGDNSSFQTYHYDSFGNLNQISPGTVQSNLLPLPNNQLQGVGYDPVGNVNSFNNGLFTSSYSYNSENNLVNVNNGTTVYTYDAEGHRVRKTDITDWMDYVYFNDVPIAERNDDGTWTDYVFANGRRIARADGSDIHIHISGTNCSGCGSTNTAAGTSSLTAANNYVIRQGDLLSWRQYQTGVAAGGVDLVFGDNTTPNGSLQDTDGQPIEADQTHDQWHARTVDLSAFANKTISSLSLGNNINGSPGNWDLFFADISLISTDGSVITLYDRSLTSLNTFQGAAVSSLSAVTEKQSGSSSLDTTYYHGDQIESARLMTTAQGWPISTDNFYPFGQEIAPSADPNHYKFTGKERDAESGLDYFGARYLSSSMGRWMSPDWSAKPEAVPYSDLSNPQSLNLYGYVNNNPLSKADKDGHCLEDACVVEGATAVVAFGALTVSAYLQTPSGQRSLADAASSAAATISSTFQSLFSKGDKAPPNPNGSKGAPDHQATADEEAAKMGENGQREVRIPTPGGAKETRVADAATVESGKVTAVTQVIRPKKNGEPPKREVEAAKDIENATGVKPKLVPVRPLPNQ